MERRSFLKTACACCGAMAALSILEQSCKKEDTSVNFTVDLNDSANAALNNAGGYIYKNSVIVICVSAGSYVALAQACTHEGCTVAYNSSQSKVTCACHGGVFNTNGTVVSGPPPSALQKFNVSQSGTVLTITS